MLGWRLKPTHSYALPKYLTVFIPTQIPELYTNGLSQEERQKHAYIKVFQTVTNKLERNHDKHHDYRGRQNILSIQHLKYSSSCIIPKHTTIINIYKRTLIFLFEAGLNFPTGTGPVWPVTGQTGPDRFRFRSVWNRPQFKIQIWIQKNEKFLKIVQDATYLMVSNFLKKTFI